MINLFLLGGLALTAALLIARSHRTAGTNATNNALIAQAILNGSNPYRIGAYVYVQELAERTDNDWLGIVIGMDRNTGMCMVRDDATNVVAHVNKDQMFGAKR